MTAITARPFRRLMRSEEPEWLVWALVIGMILVGLLVRTIITTRTVDVTEGNLTVTYPAEWVNATSENPYEVMQRSEPLLSSLFPASVRVAQMPATEIGTNADSLDDLALQWTIRQAEELEGYRVLSIEPVKVQNIDAAQVNYAYIADPLLGGPGAVPIVARGQDILIPQGDTVTIMTFTADADAYEGLTATRQRILGSIELK